MSVSVKDINFVNILFFCFVFFKNVVYGFTFFLTCGVVCFQEYCVRCRSGEVTMRKAAEALQMSPTTFRRRFGTWAQNTDSECRHFGTLLL